MKLELLYCLQRRVTFIEVGKETNVLADRPANKVSTFKRSFLCSIIPIILFFLGGGVGSNVI